MGAARDLGTICHYSRGREPHLAVALPSSGSRRLLRLSLSGQGGAVLLLSGCHRARGSEVGAARDLATICHYWRGRDPHPLAAVVLPSSGSRRLLRLSLSGQGGAVLLLSWCRGLGLGVMWGCC